jgi:hypothetical protein
VKLIALLLMLLPSIVWAETSAANKTKFSQSGKTVLEL